MPTAELYRRDIAYYKRYRQEHQFENRYNSKKHYADYLERYAERNRLYWWKLKMEIIQAYGGICVCCGETRLEFLTIDHIYGDGAKDRATHRGQNFYLKLKRDKFPQGRLRVLCMNCNFAFRRGYCPHQQEG